VGCGVQRSFWCGGAGEKRRKEDRGKRIEENSLLSILFSLFSLRGGAGENN